MAGSAHQRRYAELRRRLRDARASAGLTQRDVAARLNRPPSFIAKVESGERRLDVLELDDLAAIYGKPLDWFVPSRAH